MRIISTIAALLIALGVAWGFVQWVGDGSAVFSDEWWSNLQALTGQLTSFGEETGSKLPSPDEMGLPSIEGPGAGTDNIEGFPQEEIQ